MKVPDVIFNPGMRLLAAAFIASFVVMSAADAHGETIPLGELNRHTHIHGLAVDRTDTDQLLIATHHGIFRVGQDRLARRISPVKDIMGFTPHPGEPRIFYGSGHPLQGGNLGFIVSTDGGANWLQRSPGVNGPVDFHQMTVSPVDPDIVFGAYGALQRSENGGHDWAIVGPLPDDLISLAASARDGDTLFAGTRNGLETSRDGGRSWQPILEGFAVTLVAVDGTNSLYAFIPGHGLIRADEATLDFVTLAQSWGDHIVLHMAFDPDDPSRLFVASHHSVIFASEDGGRNWSTLTGAAD